MILFSNSKNSRQIELSLMIIILNNNIETIDINIETINCF